MTYHQTSFAKFLRNSSKLLILFSTLIAIACEKYYYVPEVNKPHLKNGDIRIFRNEKGDADTLLVTIQSTYDISDKTYFYQEIHYRYDLLKKSVPDSLIFSFVLATHETIFHNWERLDTYTLRNNQQLDNTFYSNGTYYQLNFGLIRYTYLNRESFELFLK